MESEIEIAITGGPPWGFSITGGREHNKELRVSKIEGGGIAERSGLSVGDKVIEINNTEVDRRNLAVDFVLKSGNCLILKVLRPNNAILSDSFYARRIDHLRSFRENKKLIHEIQTNQGNLNPPGPCVDPPFNKSIARRHQRTSTIDSGISLECFSLTQNSYRPDSINCQDHEFKRIPGQCLSSEHSYYPSKIPVTSLKCGALLNQSYPSSRMELSSVPILVSQSVENLRPLSQVSVSTIDSASSDSTIAALPINSSKMGQPHSYVSSARMPQPSRESYRANTEPRQWPPDNSVKLRENSLEPSPTKSPSTRTRPCSSDNSFSSYRRSCHFESSSQRSSTSFKDQELLANLHQNERCPPVKEDSESKKSSHLSSLSMKRPLKSPPHTSDSPPVLPPRKSNASKNTPRQHSKSPQKVTPIENEASHFNFNSETNNNSQSDSDSKRSETKPDATTITTSSETSRTVSSPQIRRSSNRHQPRETLTQNYYIHQLREKQVEFIPKTRYSPSHNLPCDCTTQETLSPKASPQATSPHLSFSKRKSLQDYSDLPPAHMPPPLPPRSVKRNSSASKRSHTPTILSSKSEQHLYQAPTADPQDETARADSSKSDSEQKAQLPHQNNWSFSMPLLERESEPGKSSLSCDLSKPTEEDNKKFYPDSYIHVRPNIRRGFGGDYRRKFSDSGLSFSDTVTKFNPKLSNGEPQTTKPTLLKTHSVAVDHFSVSSSVTNSQSENAEVKELSSCPSSASYSSTKPDSYNNVFEEINSDLSVSNEANNETVSISETEEFDVESALNIDWCELLQFEPTERLKFNETISRLTLQISSSSLISSISKKKFSFIRRLSESLNFTLGVNDLESMPASTNEDKDDQIDPLSTDQKELIHSLVQSVKDRQEVTKQRNTEEKSHLNELSKMSNSFEEIFQETAIKPYKSKFKRLQDNTVSVLKLLCQLSRRISNLDSRLEAADPDSADSTQISNQIEELSGQLKEAQVLRKSVHQNQINLGKSLKDLLQRNQLETVLQLFKELSTTIVRHQILEAFIKDDEELTQTIQNELLITEEDI